MNYFDRLTVKCHSNKFNILIHILIPIRLVACRVVTLDLIGQAMGPEADSTSALAPEWAILNVGLASSWHHQDWQVLHISLEKSTGKRQPL